LLEHARFHREAELLRAFLAILEQHAGNQPGTVDGRSLEEWMGWARRWIEAHDPVSRGPVADFTDVSKVTNWTYPDD
jgi:hypothetical protein